MHDIPTMDSLSRDWRTVRELCERFIERVHASSAPEIPTERRSGILWDGFAFTKGRKADDQTHIRELP